jgi:hypothetical protein
MNGGHTLICITNFYVHAMPINKLQHSKHGLTSNKHKNFEFEFTLKIEYLKTKYSLNHNLRFFLNFFFITQKDVALYYYYYYTIM